MVPIGVRVPLRAPLLSRSLTRIASDLALSDQAEERPSRRMALITGNQQLPDSVLLD